jgi:capsular polysaccharide biosynthesis protein
LRQIVGAVRGSTLSPPASVRGISLRSWGGLRGAVLATVIAMAIAGAVAYITTASEATVYGAQADILFETSDFIGGAAPEQVMETQRIVLASRAVVEPAARRARVPVEAVEDSLDTEVVPTSNVLRLTVADTDRQHARQLAADVAESYVLTVSSQSRASFARGRVRARIVTPAHVLEEPLRPRPAVTVVVSVLATALLGAGVLALIAYRRAGP